MLHDSVLSSDKFFIGLLLVGFSSSPFSGSFGLLINQNLESLSVRNLRSVVCDTLLPVSDIRGSMTIAFSNSDFSDSPLVVVFSPDLVVLGLNTGDHHFEGVKGFLVVLLHLVLLVVINLHGDFCVVLLLFD